MEKGRDPGRLPDIEEDYAALGQQILHRLDDLSVEFLSGAGVWIVRSDEPIRPAALRQRLEGLAVQLADEASFTTMGSAPP